VGVTVALLGLTLLDSSPTAGVVWSMGEMIVPFPGMMDSVNAPAWLKKDGSDWFVLYNPRKVGWGGGRKPVDVSLVHNFVHDRCVRS
jgi:hypothetical protein